MIIPRIPNHPRRNMLLFERPIHLLGLLDRDAHIRLANPHTKESMATRILRRPFNYSRGVSNSGQLDMGLLFICYQANLSTAFIAIQTRLNGEPLEEYIQPVGGGYFFVLPGAPTPHNYLGQSLIEAAAALARDQQSIVPNSREG